MFTTWTIGWLALGVAWLALEFGALFTRGRVGTFSYQIWWLRSKKWGRAAAMAIWVWAGYHFFWEPNKWTTTLKDDVTVLVVVAIAGAFFVHANTSRLEEAPGWFSAKYKEYKARQRGEVPPEDQGHSG